MKLLYFGDMHERVVPPENRKDNFRETLNRKVNEIKELGRKHKVSAFLEPGDFLQSPKYDYAFLADIIQRWTPLNISDLMQMIMLGKFTPEKIAEEIKGIAPIIGVAGNHELFGESLVSLPKTSINFLNEVGLIQFATKENPIILHTEDGLKIAITGTHYHNGMDKPENINDYIVEEKLGDIHIHIVHGYLTNKSFGDLFRHTTVDQIADKTKADLTITGHDHIGFDLIEHDGKYFVNPGSPIRLTNDLKEMKRRPKVLLIDITKDGGLKVKNIYLKSALDGEEVLDRTKIQQKQEKSDKMQQIKSTVQKAGLRKGTDITEIIASIAENKNFPITRRNELIEAVTEKIKLLNPDTHNFEDYYITKIVLENFQSHEYTEIDCSPKLNVFVGKSRQGKTAILRALSWIYEDGSKNSRRLIKTGKDFAKVTIYLSNGYIISRIVERKKTGTNGYSVYNPYKNTTEDNNTKILPIIQEILGFTSLNLGTKNPVPLNFLKQGEGWFFIGKGYSSPERAKIIGGIYGTHYCDAVIKDLEAKDKKLDQELKIKKKDLDKVDKDIAQYDHLPKMEQEIKRKEALLKRILELKEKRDKIVEIVNSKKEISKKITRLETAVEKLSSIDKAKEHLEVLKAKVDRKQKIEEIIKTRETIKEKGEYQREILVKTKKLPNARVQLDTLKDLYKKKVDKEVKVKEAKSLIKNIEVMDKKIQYFDNIIKSTSNLSKSLELISKIKELQSLKKEKSAKIEAVKILKDSLTHTDKKIKYFEVIIASTDNLSKSLESIKRVKELQSLRQGKSDKVIQARTLKDNCDTLTKKIKLTEKVVNATDGLEITKIKIEKLKSLIDKHSKFKEISKNKKEITKQGIAYKKKKEDAITKNEQLIEEYKGLLQKAGKCPVCFGTIDKATVNRIVDKFSNHEDHKAS
jgi:Calcineurin-like phosphoesterase.